MQNITCPRPAYISKKEYTLPTNKIILLAALYSIYGTAAAGGNQVPEQMLQPILVESRGADPIGIADSATQGVVSGKQLDKRPLSRTAEILEVVPGMIVTQHSGDGKANHYYDTRI